MYLYFYYNNNEEKFIVCNKWLFYKKIKNTITRNYNNYSIFKGFFV